MTSSNNSDVTAFHPQNPGTSPDAGADTDVPRRTLTEDGGQPVGDNQNSRTAGPQGPVLLDNFHLIQKLARFDRERIPERRSVHARGVGVHGQFVSHADWSEFTKAKLFSSPGKATSVFVRFSTVIHPQGSPESLRDPRGFAVKFYTEEGNWDLVGNNLPVFFIRDAMKFPDMVHALKPSPVTNQQDPNRVFDFFSHIPESTHMLTFVYSDMGTPANLRQMDGFGVHAFKWVNARGQVTYVKFNWRSQQGHNDHTAQEAAAATAVNHSNHTQDLYEAIGRGAFPSWELGVQMLTADQLENFDFDPLDATKIWTNVPEAEGRHPDTEPRAARTSSKRRSRRPSLLGWWSLESNPRKIGCCRVGSSRTRIRQRLPAGYKLLDAADQPACHRGREQQPARPDELRPNLIRCEL